MKDSPKISLVITVRNEAESIASLFASIAAQTVLPTEVVVVDGGSTDETVSLLQKFAHKWPQLHLRIEAVSGSIAVGRNTGVRLAKYNWIAMTDAGCVLESDWLEQLLVTEQASGAQIVAGYAVGDPHSAFEAAVVPYVLVMPDAVDLDSYLPATRSMLFQKAVWKQLGGFPESVAVSEDYAFARAARAANILISFAAQAVVRWRPRTSGRSFFWMIFSQARDDVRAGSLRPKVGLVWARYIVGLLSLWFVAGLAGLNAAVIFGFAALIAYSSWAVWKNYKYVGAGWVWLPVLQLLADGGVVAGSGLGLVRKYL